MKVYQSSGVVDTLLMTTGSSVSHSRQDLTGVEHSDYVSLFFTNSEGTHQYLLVDLDSLVFPSGRRVVFHGSQVDRPSYARIIGYPLDSLSLSGASSDIPFSPRRTSFHGTFPGQGTGNVTFFWTENDRIRLDVGEESRAEQLSQDKTRASFVFEDSDLDADSYTVYYPGKHVTIASDQHQTGADNTDHIGPSGDCGVATAMRNPADGSYGFTLNHKASYLCFLPHINHLPSARVSRIDVTCNNAIAGTFELSGSGMFGGTNTSSSITLELTPQRARDFFLGHNVRSEQDSCAAYMVIAPQDGSRSFTVTYHVTDTLSRIEKLFRQTINFQPLANTVYPISCNIRDTEFRSIDLGLSCNWSNVNIDATEPSRHGSIFSSDAEANAALLEQTVVTEWLMPTDDQREELIEKCLWTWGEYNGQTGYIVEGAAISKEYGKKLRIFIPCASGTTKAECLSQNFRPVETLMVDLGLPSGTKWAAKNIGANSAEDAGYYFAWGETETKETYGSGNYRWGTQNLGDDYDISATQNDAAAVLWGGIWRMPTKAEMEELMNTANCQWTWTSINGINGYLVSSKAEGNINKIFLPAAGLITDSSLRYGNEGASYQTSTQGGDRKANAWTLSWNKGCNSAQLYLCNTDEYYPFYDRNTCSQRCYGRVIRPVANPNAIASDGSVFNIQTDSAGWKLGQTEAVLYGTLSSTMPFQGSITVGFVVGDSATIVKGRSRFEYEQQVVVGGSFSQVQPVYDNIGYWYRAYVNTGDTIFYDKARHYGYEMVDLGLSVRWANMNLGADAPEDYGGYYAWGETTEKDTYSSSTYLYGTTNLGEHYDICTTENDAAHVLMGNAWRMPKYSELKELVDSCTWVMTSQNNVNGYKVTGKNGNSIFLPCAGILVDNTLWSDNTGASYQTSTQGGDGSANAWTLSWNKDCNSAWLYLNNTGEYYPFYNRNVSSQRYHGRVIRPVANTNAGEIDGMQLNILTDSASWHFGDTSARIYGTLSTTTPVASPLTVGFIIGDNDSITKPTAQAVYPQSVSSAGQFSHVLPVHDNFGCYYRAFVEVGDSVFYGKVRHYGLEFVDLGIGTLWANMNVGANTPEEYGNYYAWGETMPKTDYSQSTYQFGTQNLGNNYNINGTRHDAAHVNMGNAWLMPTSSELKDLNDKCTWQWTTQNNVTGYKVTGPNGNSIFLPCAGLMRGSNLDFASVGASYATSTLYGEYSWHTWTLSWYQQYSQNGRYFISNNEWVPFQNYGSGTVRYFGRTIRAVYKPNAVDSDNKLNILTDSATWRIGDTSARVYGVISSFKPLANGCKVGFVVGDSMNIEKHNATVYTVATDTYGRFSANLTINNNIGYWYRAYIEMPDGDIYYGEARHVGWEMVDLGLPSGTLWCNVDVGAAWPEDYGDYFAWGETTTKTSYTSSNYLYGTSLLGNNGDIAGTIYDAAYVNMGHDWCMPTNTQWRELLDNCVWSRIPQNDVCGYVITSKTNGNSIFLPSAGFYVNENIELIGTGNSYQSSICSGEGSTFAWTLSWNKDYSPTGVYLNYGNEWTPFQSYGKSTVRYFGRSIRPVANRP